MTKERFKKSWSIKRKQGPVKYVVKLSGLIMLLVVLAVYWSMDVSGVDAVEYIKMYQYKCLLVGVFMAFVSILISINVWREYERRYMYLTESMPIGFEEV